MIKYILLLTLVLTSCSTYIITNIDTDEEYPGKVFIYTNRDAFVMEDTCYCLPKLHVNDTVKIKRGIIYNESN